MNQHSDDNLDDTWVQVASSENFDAEGLQRVELDGRAICLYRLGSQVFATDDTCTHGQASLADGTIIDAHLIECPLHEGTFDIRTGAPTGAPCSVALACHEVRVNADAIFLRRTSPHR